MDQVIFQPLRITVKLIYCVLHDTVMSRPKLPNQRRPLSIRLPQEVINDSKSIPLFRKRLENLAIQIHLEWKKKEDILKEGDLMSVGEC